MIYTNRTLFAALRSIIPNLPENCTELTLKMRGGSEPPIVEAAIYAMPAINDETVVCKTFETFYLVDSKNWDQARKFIAFSKSELERMS